MNQNKKLSSPWHKKLYGPLQIRETLNAPRYHKTAKTDVEFLIQSLKLNKNHNILDVPCGAGRHTLCFGKKGFFVTGVEINKHCLKLAQKNCRNLKTVAIKKANMKNLSWAKNKFDLVINLYTSFGYFKTDKENQSFLYELVKSVKPGGHLVIQTINRDWLLKVFSPVDWSESPHSYYMHGRKYDPKTNYMEGYNFYLDKKSGKGEKAYHRIRLYSISEMKKLLSSTGLVSLKVFANTKAEAVNKYSSDHPLFIGKKPKRKIGKKNQPLRE